MESVMNIKMKSIVSVLAMSTVMFAAEAAPVTESTNPVEASAPVEEAAPAPVDESAAPVAAEAAAPAEEPAASVEPVVANSTAPVAENVPEEEIPAPTAVRGVDASAPVAQTSNSVEPKVQSVAPSKTSENQYVYETTPVKVVYIREKPSADTVTFDDIRGFVPMKLRFGLEGFVGSYSLYASDTYYDEFDAYSGLTWRAGAFAIVPLNEYTVGFKIGALYEQSDASASSSRYGASVKFKQSKVDIPLLFTFKGARSTFMFEVGAQAAIPVKDEMKVSFGSQKSKLDMIDNDSRKTVDWDIVMGFAIMANQYIGLDLRFDLGLSQMYDSIADENMDIFNLNDLSSASFLVGVSFYLF